MRRIVQAALFRRALRAWKPDLGGSPSFRKKKGFPPDPLSEGNRFATSSTRRGRRMRRCPASDKKRWAQPSEAAFLGESARGGFFLLKESSLSQEGSCFYPAFSDRRGRRARAFLYSGALLRSGAPSARRNRKPMRLSWGRAREGGFFLLKESPLSQKRKRLPFPKRLSWGWGLGKGSSFF